MLEIEGIFRARQTHLRSNEYLVKYKGCHHKELMWMKIAHLDHLQKMMNKFEQEKGNKLGMLKTRKNKKTHLQMV
jgi:hypothetical protein